MLELKNSLSYNHMFGMNTYLAAIFRPRKFHNDLTASTEVISKCIFYGLLLAEWVQPAPGYRVSPSGGDRSNFFWCCFVFACYLSFGSTPKSMPNHGTPQSHNIRAQMYATKYAVRITSGRGRVNSSREQNMDGPTSRLA